MYHNKGLKNPATKAGAKEWKSWDRIKKSSLTKCKVKLLKAREETLNGLKSLDDCMGAANTGYHRVRIGVGHPRNLGLPLAPADYVLQPFTQTECAALDTLFEDVADAVELILAGNVLQAMNRYNKTQQATRQ